MKKFYVAVCCTLLLSGSWVMAQDEIASPVPPAPAQEVLSAAPAAQSQGSVIVGEATPLYTEGSYGSVAAPGCSSCGSSIPQTFTSAPAVAQGCSTCATPVTFTSAPVAQDCCPAPAPTCCPAPAPTCCDPCAKPPRQGFFAKRRAKRAAASSCCPAPAPTCCCN